MLNSRRPIRPDRPAKTGARGFVLPWVLVFVLVFATIAMIGVEAARRGQRLARGLEAEVAAERALATAESRAVFKLLTARPVQGGVDLAETDSAATGMMDGLPDISGQASFWSGKGGWRDAGNGVDVRYQDSAGLVSLNATTTEELVALLSHLGVESGRAETLAARLFDYTDENIRRRFKGAERPAYRLRRRPAPTNSPLRSLEEARNVLGWAEEARLWRPDGLRRLATVHLRNTPTVRAFMPETLRAAISEDVTQAATKNLVGIGALGNTAPSSRARLTFRVGVDGAYGPRVLTRTIAIARRPDAADRPYYRTFLFETRRSETDDGTDNALPPLFPADSSGS